MDKTDLRIPDTIEGMVDVVVRTPPLEASERKKAEDEGHVRQLEDERIRE